MAVGNFMAQYQEAFQNASEEEIIGTANNSIDEFVEQSGMHTPDDIFVAMVWAAKVGIATKTGTLNKKEKKITNEVFKRIWNGDMEEIYEMLSQNIQEAEFQWLELVGSTAVGIELLKFILAFAYIDGKMDDAIAERLEKCFSMSLMSDFFNGVPEDEE